MSQENDLSSVAVMAEPESCPICRSAMTGGRKSWLYQCAGCGFQQADLLPEIHDADARAAVDERRRATALGQLRAQNFERILDRLAPLLPAGGKALLDVGCAHGWFLDAASMRGIDAVGLEPDPAIGAVAAAGGRKVWSGFFPDDVPQGAQFDVISFNDVLEHVPDVAGAVEACRRLLRPGGVLVINAPSSAGIFYRSAAALDRLGIGGPFARMWQTGFASPHLSYFTPEQLRRLVEQHGFTEIHRSSLPSVQVAGLWARLAYDRTASPAGNSLIWAAVVLFSPMIRHLPADITLQMFRIAK